MDGALELFATSGLLNTSVDQIARTVGVRKANIFYYFPTRDDLAVAALERVEAITLRQLSETEDPVALLFGDEVGVSHDMCCWLRIMAQTPFLTDGLQARAQESMVTVHKLLAPRLGADAAWGVLTAAMGLGSLPDNQSRLNARTWHISAQK